MFLVTLKRPSFLVYVGLQSSTSFVFSMMRRWIVQFLVCLAGRLKCFGEVGLITFSLSIASQDPSMSIYDLLESFGSLHTIHWFQVIYQYLTIGASDHDLAFLDWVYVFLRGVFLKPFFLISFEWRRSTCFASGHWYDLSAFH